MLEGVCVFFVEDNDINVEVIKVFFDEFYLDLIYVLNG